MERKGAKFGIAAICIGGGEASGIKVVSLIAAPEGINKLTTEHPDVQIYIAVLDRQFNQRGFILPGLGDAGDRVFGTEN